MLVGQKNIEGVDRNPSSKDARMKNIELVLKFLEEEQVSLPENAFKGEISCTQLPHFMCVCRLNDSWSVRSVGFGYNSQLNM